MKLIKDRIYAKVITPPKTKGGLILSPNDNLDQYTAQVVDVGPQVKYLKKGDVIRYVHNLAEYNSDKSGKFIFIRESEAVILECGTTAENIPIL